MKCETKRLLKIGIGILLLFICIRSWDTICAVGSAFASAASPLLAGGCLAYLVNILMSWYERHYFPRSSKKSVTRTRRVVCLIAALLTMLGVIALIVLLVIPQLWNAVMLLVSEVPDTMQTVIAFAESLEILPEDIFAVLEKIDWKSQLTRILSALGNGVGSVVDVAVNVVVSVLSSVINALLAIIFALYLLLARETLSRQCKKVMTRYLRPHICDKVLHVLAVLNDCFHNYIVGQCTEAVILGLLCTMGMLLLDFPYATMVGALVAFTALIPIAGAYIGAGVGAFMIMTVSPIKALFFLVYIVVLQQLEGNIIYPRVVGSSIGLPGLWVLAAVTIGGGVMGITGMLFGVPLAAALYRLLREHVNQGAAVDPAEPPAP